VDPQTLFLDIIIDESQNGVFQFPVSFDLSNQLLSRISRSNDQGPYPTATAFSAPKFPHSPQSQSQAAYKEYAGTPINHEHRPREVSIDHQEDGRREDQRTEGDGFQDCEDVSHAHIPPEPFIQMEESEYRKPHHEDQWQRQAELDQVLLRERELEPEDIRNPVRQSDQTHMHPEAEPPAEWQKTLRQRLIHIPMTVTEYWAI
jgi:hypothetical protein